MINANDIDIEKLLLSMDEKKLPEDDVNYYRVSFIKEESCEKYIQSAFVNRYDHVVILYDSLDDISNLTIPLDNNLSIYYTDVNCEHNYKKELWPMHFILFINKFNKVVTEKLPKKTRNSSSRQKRSMSSITELIRKIKIINKKTPIDKVSPTRKRRNTVPSE